MTGDTRKLSLKTSEIIQGDWSIGDLNLLLVFQVNCPGCFMHALPAALELRERYPTERLRILTLSTAFEDFELNTPENARSLVEQGTLVGETLRAFESMDHRSLPYEMNLPLAVDLPGAPGELFGETELDFIAKLVPDHEKLSEAERDILRGRIKEFVARSPIASYTFTLNQLRGTPSWILFDAEYQVQDEWFGHREIQEVIGRLDSTIAGRDS